MEKDRRPPFFLGIGAQKAGTSYLYECLRQHEEIALPPIKELHWFDEAQELETRHLINRLRNLSHPRNKRWFKVFFLSGTNALLKGHINSAIWIARFMVARRDYSANSFLRYKKLTGDHFYPNATGDITPYYAVLHKDSINRIQQLMPDNKIIYLIRNPVERDLSEINMYARDYRIKEFSHIPLELRKTVARECVHSRYLQNLKNWVEAYGRPQVHVELFDVLTENPQQAMDRIFDFLQLPKMEVPAYLIGKKVNKSTPIEIDPSFKQHLNEKYSSEIEALARYLSMWQHVEPRTVRKWAASREKD